MNAHSPLVHRSVCPHDCPSVCALEVEIGHDGRIGRVRGSKVHAYTAGVICAKVARYAERIHHPDRLTQPLIRTGPKGSGQFRPASWDEALDLTARAFLAAEAEHGPEAVWPYYYAGTMGHVMRDGINRLRHAKRYSGFHSTICTAISWAGWMAGAGRMTGVDPTEMRASDVIVIWGTNAVATQVNVMTHAVKARKDRGAKIVAVDVYRNATCEQADMALILKPGTDAALACAMMHVAFRDGFADIPYMARYADCPDALAAHLATRTPEWASAITGLSVDEIEAFAALLGTTKRTFFRLGYGFTRSRNGQVAMHAALSVPTVLGCWAHEGGGALHSMSGGYGLNKSEIEGLDARRPGVRALDQSRIGAVLEGDRDALNGGPPVTAMLIQNTNPVSVAPDQNAVRRGFAREDLFVAVHEQFMTETAAMADVVLPATMFLEHDDLYTAGGNAHILLGPKLVDPPGECRSNHDVLAELAKRLGAEHPAFAMTPRELIDRTLRASGRGTFEELEAAGFVDVTPPFEQAHFLNGFGWPDGRFRFAADWARVKMPKIGMFGEVDSMPSLPDHWDATEKVDAEHPFRLTTSPARSFLNSSFTETPGSLAKEGRPTVMIHPQDASAAGIVDGDLVALGNARGRLRLHAEITDAAQPGVLVAESIWPAAAHVDGQGINVLTGADPVAPYGGAAFHDNRVWLRAGAARPLTA